MHPIDTLHAKLTQLQATAGTNDKLAIVQSLSEDELYFVCAALDPGANFYIGSIPETTHGDLEWGNRETTLLWDLNKRLKTGNAARDALMESLTTLKKEHAHVLRRIILKDLGVGVGVTMLNKAFPGSIKVVPYMRCTLPADSNLEQWDRGVWARGVPSQLKADGMFAALTTTADGVSVVSRQGSVFPYDALPELYSPKPQLMGTQLHGELLVVFEGKVLNRREGNGLLNSLLQDGELPAGHTVKYVVWDLIPANDAVAGGVCDVPYHRRLESLRGAVAEHPAMEVVETRLTYSLQEANAHYKEVLGRGLEGTIVKHPDSSWKDARSSGSKDVVKLKLEFQVELRVKGFVPGKGKNASTFGSLECESHCGALEANVSGMTDGIRKAIAARGKAAFGMIITVKANEVLFPSASNDKHSLSHGRFIEERRDKEEADTLERILAQQAAAIAA